jgi:phosphatidate phosphatase APP1
MYLVANGTCTVLLQNLLKFINYPGRFIIEDIKTSLTDFFLTARGHNHKFEKKHILEFYPNLEYVLLGDDSHDPFYMRQFAKFFQLQ